MDRQQGPTVQYGELYSISCDEPSWKRICITESLCCTVRITHNIVNQLLLVSDSVLSDSLQPHRLQHTRLPCPSPSPGAYSNSCPRSQWCHSTISSSVCPLSSCLQSFPGSGSFPMSWLFASGGQSIGASASASVLPMNIQGWFPLGLTGLQCPGC